MFSSAGSNRIQIDLLYCSFKPVRVCYCFSVYLKTEDRGEERETSVICFKKYPHQESLGLAST